MHNLISHDSRHGRSSGHGQTAGRLVTKPLEPGTKLKGGMGVVHPPNLGKMPFRRAKGHKKIVFVGQIIE